MAALDGIRLEAHEVQNMVSERDVKNWLRQAFWSWFDANQNDEVYTLKVWVIKKTFYLRDLQYVFERFFGPRVQIN